MHTSDTVMRLDALPPRMAVIGGGFIACEMAHVFAALGVAVTQVQRSPTLLRHEEVEVAQRYTEVARRRYDLRLSTTPTSARAGRAASGGSGSRALAAPATSRPRSCCSPWAGIPTPTSSTPPPGACECHDDGRLVVDARAAHDGIRASGRSATSAPRTSSSTSPTTRRGSSRTTSRSTSDGSPGPPLADDGRPVPHAVFGHPQVAVVRADRGRARGRPAPRSSARPSPWATSRTAGRSRTPPAC